MAGDDTMRAFMDRIAVPTFDETPFTTPKPLSEAKVTIVTTGGVRLEDQSGWTLYDQSFRELPTDGAPLVLGHLSPNIDWSGFLIDTNVVFPIDRLHELVDRGVIGSIGPRAFSFTGNQDEDMSVLRHDTGPAVAAALQADGIDVVLLTPV